MSNTDIETLIGKNSKLTGDIQFRGGLHVDGTVKGNLTAEPGAEAAVTISEHGRVEGEVRVPRVLIDGALEGDVYASDRIELAARARVKGNIHYKTVQMALGAQVNGTMVYEDKPESGTGKGKGGENQRPVRAVGGES